VLLEARILKERENIRMGVLNRVKRTIPLAASFRENIHQQLEALKGLSGQENFMKNFRCIEEIEKKLV